MRCFACTKHKSLAGRSGRVPYIENQFDIVCLLIANLICRGRFPCRPATTLNLGRAWKSAPTDFILRKISFSNYVSGICMTLAGGQRPPLRFNESLHKPFSGRHGNRPLQNNHNTSFSLFQKHTLCVFQ